MTNGTGSSVWAAPFVIRHLEFIPMITHCEGDNVFRSRQHLLRLHTLVRVALQVIHFAVLVLREPILEFGGVVGRKSRGEMAIVKSQLAGSLADGCFHHCAA